MVLSLITQLVWFVLLIVDCFLGRGMPVMSILNVVPSILGEYELVAMHSGPVHVYFVGVWFSGTVKFDPGKYITSHALDPARLLRPEKLSQA